MGDPPPAPRRPLFDLNVAVDEFEEEFEEEPQEMEQVVEVREVVEEEEEEVEEEEPQEMIMEEDEEEAEAAAEAAQEEEEDAIVEKEVVEEAGMMAEAGEDEGRRKKRKEYEVFVFGLPPEAVEENVAGALAEAGEVEEVRLVRDPAEPQLNKGFAFVRFAEVWQARWAADDLRTAKIKGKACGICKNNDNETLHLRNICFDWSKDDLAENLKTFELENLEDINLIEHPDRKGKNRGYAFLDFSSHVDAVAGFLKLQKRDLYLGTDIKAQISFSNTISQDDKVMEKVKSVFLDGLPPHWDEDDVREKFGKFGEIDNIQLARNMFTAKRKDFGFISFTTRQAAIDCIDMVNKGRFGEGSGKVRMKATLQRPKPTFKKPSWQGDTHMLGVRRGFIGKSHGDREPYPNRFRHLGHERRAYSNNFAHGNYRHQPMVGRSPPMAVDDGERPVSLREYRSYYRRDSAVPDHSHKYGRAHPGTRIREGYDESRYASKYPKHKHAAYEASMQRDEYRSKYGHSYLERAHSESCPECIRGDHNSSAYQNGRYSSGDKAGHRYQCQNGEEFSATSGPPKAFYKTDHEPTPSTSQGASQRKETYREDPQSMPSSPPVMCDCSECYKEQKAAAPPSSQSAVTRTHSNPQVPPHRRIAKPYHDQRSFVPDEYEVEYTIRERRGRYLSARDGHSTHPRKYSRQGR
ncbi:nucleolin [Brachypodium distachyon]|uniref:RRM domain-containing protein n=1 Tax=Brachypodium distachyon TaxID=15368 RepID=I1GUR8_BRADI|nr:nucleolin [Brachypodium distachyon]KQK16423.1 hypothetical protein BRADI_1g28670v3 [Brachypodium distachyon]|eukprot:XP_010238822.1 nucleolin [Brachypodium distachyon]